MNGTIICTIDGSAAAAAAADVARQLADRFDARIVVVSVAGAEPVTRDGARDEHRVAAGDPAEAVAVIAAEEAADLVVVGARGGFFGRLLGSGLARELAATAPCPVLVVLPEAGAARGERITSPLAVES